MTVHGRPRKRQRTTAVEEPNDPWRSGALVHSVKPLLERLLSFREQVIATRDEETQRASDIQERINAREAASRAVETVIPPPPSDDIAVFSRGVRVEKGRRRQAPPQMPPLPALKLVMEQDPPEKLIHEQSIIVRAQAINRKNAELARERLPKQPEAQRNKTYHDYFLDEVLWMAADFREERKWKIQMAKKVSKMVAQFHTQRSQREARAKVEAHQRLVKLASAVARDVRKFWSQIGEIADYKNSLLEEAKLSKARKSQLKNLLKRTAKYSSVLAQSLTQPDGVEKEDAREKVGEKQVLSGFSKPASCEEETSERSAVAEGRYSGSPSELDPVSPEPQSEEDSEVADCTSGEENIDWDMKDSEEADDEATMVAAEADGARDDNEIEELEGEADMSIENLLRLQGIDPNQYLSDKRLYDNNSDDGTGDDSDEDGDDVTGDAVDDEDDDERTIEKAEREEVRNDTEVQNLQSEANMNMAELLRAQGIDPAAYEADTEQYARSDGHSTETKNPPTKMRSFSDVAKPLSKAEDERAPLSRDSLLLQTSRFSRVNRQLHTDPRIEDGEPTSMGKNQQPPQNPISCPQSSLTIAGAVEDYRARGEPVHRDLISGSGSGTGKSVSFAKPSKQRGNDGINSSAPSPNTVHTPVSNHGVSEIKEPTELLRGRLRDYQRTGMNWLISLYKQKLNGILADEMGLGKTIQTISLLAWLAVEKGVWGPHLIVVPTSVMVNWEVEFKKWLPGFKILTYFGSMKERKLKRQGWTKPNTFHVCITSYTLAVQDATALRRKKWVYLILDEAHNIKNFESQRWQTLLSFPSQSRLLITGTPLQNSVMELWSLMHFLMPDLFESHSEFRDWFSKPVVEAASEDESRGEKSEIVANLHNVLRPFLLRRLKSDVEKGLPPKFEHVVKCPLSKRQRQLYEDFMARSDIRDTLQHGDFFGVMNILMQLRKVCNHPDLFEGRQILSPLSMRPVFYPVPALVARALSKPPERTINLDLLCLDLCSIEQKWPGKWHAAEALKISAESCIRNELLTKKSSCDVPDDWRMLGYNPSRAASDRVVSFRRSQLRYQAQLSAMRIRQHALLGQDLRDACTMNPSSLVDGLRFCHAKAIRFLPANASLLLRTLESVARTGKPFADRFVCCITRASAPTVELRYRDDDLFHLSATEFFTQLNRATHQLQCLFRPFEVRSKVTIPDTRLIQWDCGKLQILDRLLRKLQAAGSRALIFTQMTKVLDILESFLNLHGLKYLRLDGTTKTDDRQKVVERFNTDSRIFCMILTTRAGGVGLNLTGADAVVFYDTDYNPAVDNQAQDRAHRIGQTKPVNIYRLVSEQTVEENILRRANEKRNLESILISNAGFTTEAIASHSIEASKRRSPSDGNSRSSVLEPGRRISSSDHSMPVRNGIRELAQRQSLHSKTTSGKPKNDTRAEEPTSAQSVVPAISTAYGQFEGYLPSTTPGIKDQNQIDKSLQTLQYQEVTSKLLAAEDERERLAAATAEQEEQRLRAEFDESVPTTDDGDRVKRERAASSDDRDVVESSLNPVQRYALRLVESWQSGIGDFDEPETVVDWEAEFTVSKMLERRKQGHLASNMQSDGITKAAELQDVSTPESGDQEDEDDPAFYEVDISANGHRSYLKGLTDTDADIKMYLPLRDGGPEELKISTVVSGTAAAGLECAEDAAFFPHAYNRMSRTIYATLRQKEKARATSRKRKAERERKRRELEEAAALSEREAELLQPTKQTSGDKTKLGKIKGDHIRTSGTILGKRRIDNLPKNRGSGSGSGTGAAANDGLSAGTNGLFRKTTKKSSRRLPLSLGKAGLSNTIGGNPGEGIGLNDAWTKEEDQKAIRTLAECSSTMFIADALALDPRVRAGLRRRRGQKHCISRLAGLQKDAKSGPIVPRAVSTDASVMRRHFQAAATSTTKIKQAPPSWLMLPSIPTTWHPSQSKVINEARGKKTGRFANGIVPTLGVVSPSIQLPSHFKAGYKPTETTPQAQNRKRYPFLRPPRDEPRAVPPRPGSSNRPEGSQSNPPQARGVPGELPSKQANKISKMQSQVVPSRRAAGVPPIGSVRSTGLPRASTAAGQTPSSRIPDGRASLTKASTVGHAIRKRAFTPGTSTRMSIGQVGGSLQNISASTRGIGSVGKKIDPLRKTAVNKVNLASGNHSKSGQGMSTIMQSPVVPLGVVASNGVVRSGGVKTGVRNGVASTSAGQMRAATGKPTPPANVPSKNGLASSSSSGQIRPSGGATKPSAPANKVSGASTSKANTKTAGMPPVVMGKPPATPFENGSAEGANKNVPKKDGK